MIESTEAVVGRQQPETASRDGRDEGMESSKFRKLLSAFVKGGAADGSLQDLMSALVVEPLSVSKTPKKEKIDDPEPAKVEGAEEPPVGRSVERKEEDASNQALTSSHLCLEAKKVEDRQTPVADKEVVREPVAEVAPEVVPAELPKLASSEVGFEEAIAAQYSADTSFTAFSVVAGSVQTGTSAGEESVVDSGAGGDIDLLETQQSAVLPDNRPAVVANSSINEIAEDTSGKLAMSTSGAATSELSAATGEIENSGDRVALVVPIDTKGSDEKVLTDGQTSDKVLPLESPDDLPVVEGLLQLRALIERVSSEANGVGHAVAGTQAELAHSVDALEDSGLSVVSATKDAPGSKAVPNAILEKSNKGLNTAKEKTTAIPERMISKMMEKLEQVAREVERSKDGRSISLRLDPPQLGKVQVDMTMKDGSIHTRLTAESAIVAQFLRERGDELQALIRKSLPNLDQATISFGKSSTGNDFGRQMNFSDDSSKGFLNNRGHDGDSVFGSVSGGGERTKTDRRRAELTGSSEHWVA